MRQAFLPVNSKKAVGEYKLYRNVVCISRQQAAEASLRARAAQRNRKVKEPLQEKNGKEREISPSTACTQMLNHLDLFESQLSLSQCSQFLLNTPLLITRQALIQTEPIDKSFRP
jgi:hypothetical protein